MTEIEIMVTSPTTQRCKVASSFGGSAMSVQKATYIAGWLLQTRRPLARSQEDVLFVLGISFVNATLWKMSVLMLLLILTLKRMVSILLK